MQIVKNEEGTAPAQNFADPNDPDTKITQQMLDQDEVLEGVALLECAQDEIMEQLEERFLSFVSLRQKIKGETATSRRFVRECAEQFVDGLVGPLMSRTLDTLRHGSPAEEARDRRTPTMVTQKLPLFDDAKASEQAQPGE